MLTTRHDPRERAAPRYRHTARIIARCLRIHARLSGVAAARVKEANMSTHAWVLIGLGVWLVVSIALGCAVGAAINWASGDDSENAP